MFVELGQASLRTCDLTDVLPVALGWASIGLLDDVEIVESSHTR